MKAFFFFYFLVLGALHADTLNSPLKNPSMGVIGIQRASTPIVTTVVPATVAGTACNSAVDTIAITSDRSMELICQSKVWVPVGYTVKQ